MRYTIGLLILAGLLLIPFGQHIHANITQQRSSELTPQIIDVSSSVKDDVRTPSPSLMDAINGRFLRNPFIPAQIVAPHDVGHHTSHQVHVRLANFESEPRQFESVLPLPTHTHPQQDAIGGWAYDDLTHTLRWEGILEGANLGYQVEVLETSLPYIDLAEYGVANLCQEDLEREVAFNCDNETRAFNLGIHNAYTLSLYGEQLGTIAVNSNGLLLAGHYEAQEPLANESNWLPSQQATGHLLAPLWRDNDLTVNGRFHAAILEGYLPGADVFYAQWHNVPHREDINATARYATAIVLNGPLVGNIYYIYNNVAEIEQTIELGYAVGLEDQMGERGYTYAYSGPEAAPQGVPPEGITLSFKPSLMNDEANYFVDLPFTLFFKSVSDELIPLTVSVQTDSANPDLQLFWDTIYFSIRYLNYLPLVVQHGS